MEFYEILLKNIGILRKFKMNKINYIKKHLIRAKSTSKYKHLNLKPEVWVCSHLLTTNKWFDSKKKAKETVRIY